MTFCLLLKLYTLYRTDSITQAVRDTLESDWLLFRMLQSGVANFTALASKIKPNVESRVGSSVSPNTVVAALTRLSHTLEVERGLFEDDKLPFKVNLSLSDHVFDLVTQLGGLNELMVVYEKLRGSAHVPFGLFLTSDRCRFYIESNSTHKVAEKDLPPGFKSEIGFTKIKVDFPRELVLIPNTLIYEISSMLYKTHTDVHSAFFTPSGIVLVVENHKAAKVYEMLHERLS
jgi:hypothetical protein